MKEHPHPTDNQIAEVVEHQHYLIVFATRHNRQVRHFYSVYNFMPFLEYAIPSKKLSLGIIGNTCHYVYVMPFFCQMKGNIVAPECFWIEVLADKKYFLLFICLSYCFILKYFSTNIIGFTYNDGLGNFII